MRVTCFDCSKRIHIDEAVAIDIDGRTTYICYNYAQYALSSIKNPQEPWMMTKKEFDEATKGGIPELETDFKVWGDRVLVHGFRPGRGGRTFYTVNFGKPGKHYSRHQDALYSVQKLVIEEALSKGKPVPAKVLADYPDLANPDAPKWKCSHCGAVIYSAPGKPGFCPGCKVPTKNPTLVIPIKSKKQLEHLYRAQSQLSKAGVTFDTGTQLEPKQRHWELDWSLRGTAIKNPKRNPGLTSNALKGLGLLSVPLFIGLLIWANKRFGK